MPPAALYASVAALTLLAAALLVFDRAEPVSSRCEALLARAGHGKMVALIVALAALTVGTRFVLLTTIPWRIDGDAGAFAREAAAFLSPNPPPLFGTGWWGNTNLYFFLQSLVLRVEGYSLLGMRLLGAIGGVLAVVTTAFLAKAMFGRTTAMFTALAAAVMPYHLVFSRVGSEVVHLTWIVSLGLWLIIEGWRRRSAFNFILAGLACGFAQYFHPAARLIPFLYLALMALLAIWPRDATTPIPKPWRGALALVLTVTGVLFIYAPMIQYFAENPEQYMARVNHVTLFSQGWLAKELELFPWWEIIARQLWRGFFAFLYPTGGGYFWIQPPFLAPIEGAIATFGLLCLWLRGEGPKWLRLFFAFSFGFGLFLAGVMTIDPTPTRYVIFAPFFAILVGYGLKRLCDSALGLLGETRAAWAEAGVAAALLLYAGIGTATYLRTERTALWRNSTVSDQIATAAARHLLRLGDQPFGVLYLSTPQLSYHAQPPLPFLIRRSGIDIPEGADCEAIAAALQPGLNAIITPASRLQEVKPFTSVPGTRLTEFRNDRDERFGAILEFTMPASPAGTSPDACASRRAG
jgi:4-amino-4-deoxy-L-arabinose transferase-like glycosyltransferase